MRVQRMMVCTGNGRIVGEQFKECFSDGWCYIQKQHKISCRELVRKFRDIVTLDLAMPSLLSSLGCQDLALTPIQELHSSIGVNHRNGSHVANAASREEKQFFLGKDARFNCN